MENRRKCTGCHSSYDIENFKSKVKNKTKLCRTCISCRSKILKRGYNKIENKRRCIHCCSNYDIENFKSKIKGKRKLCKTCISCRSRISVKCGHNKIKRLCVECKGSGICPHNKVKYFCLDCKGSQ